VRGKSHGTQALFDAMTVSWRIDSSANPRFRRRRRNARRRFRSADGLPSSASVLSQKPFFASWDDGTLRKSEPSCRTNTGSVRRRNFSIDALTPAGRLRPRLAAAARHTRASPRLPRLLRQARAATRQARAYARRCATKRFREVNSASDCITDTVAVILYAENSLEQMVIAHASAPPMARHILGTAA